MEAGGEKKIVSCPVSFCLYLLIYAAAFPCAMRPSWRWRRNMQLFHIIICQLTAALPRTGSSRVAKCSWSAPLRVRSAVASVNVDSAAERTFLSFFLIPRVASQSSKAEIGLRLPLASSNEPSAWCHSFAGCLPPPPPPRDSAGRSNPSFHCYCHDLPPFLPHTQAACSHFQRFMKW